jgi:Asparagine synthase
VAPPAFRRTWRHLRRWGLLGPAPIRAEFARRIRLDERLRTAAPTGLGRDIEGTRRDHWRQLTSARLAAILETVAALAGAAGVDVRDPFLDRRLMEFCLALPASQKIRVARHAPSTLLPAAIRDRPGKAPIHLMLGAAFAVCGWERLARLMDDAVRVLEPLRPRGPRAARASSVPRAGRSGGRGPRLAARHPDALAPADQPLRSIGSTRRTSGTPRPVSPAPAGHGQAVAERVHD